MNPHRMPVGSTTFIYLLHDDFNYAYVGKSSNPQERFKQHRWKRKECVGRWIKDREVHLTVLDEVPRAEWQFWEKHYISLIASWGFSNNELIATHDSLRVPGFSAPKICNCCQNKKKHRTHGGYKWKYLEDYENSLLKS